AEILVVAPLVDISPELAGCAGHIRLAGQIFTALDDRRREAEIEAEQGRLFRGAFQKPGEDLFARPDVARANQPRRGLPARVCDGNAFMPPPLRARPVDRDIAFEAVSHFLLRGRVFGRAVA